MKAEELFGKEKISRILLKLAPPVMLAQLIQSLYNIIDSGFLEKMRKSDRSQFQKILRRNNDVTDC